MATLTSQCPCAVKMRLQPLTDIERPAPPIAGELQVCVYCERVLVQDTVRDPRRQATDVEVRAGDATELNNLRDQAEVRIPKRRRRPLPRAVVLRP